MPDLLSVDAAAMALLSHDVVALTEADLDAPTPCTGWTVADLIDHMNERHQAFLAAEHEPLTIERRDAFVRIAARWGAAMENAGDTVHLPGRGPTPTERLLYINLVDMLTGSGPTNAYQPPLPTDPARPALEEHRRPARPRPRLARLTQLASAMALPMNAGSASARRMPSARSARESRMPPRTARSSAVR